MLTADQIKSIVDSLTLRQNNRLLQSNEDVDAFLKRPEEEAVSFEIDCYMNLLDKLEADAQAA